MLISKKHKALIYRLRNPERVRAVIPHAKVFQYQGKDFLAVKHGVDECRVLHNLGLPAPSPINYYYDWPGRYEPYNHQRTTADVLTLNPRAFNLDDMGLGKSLSTLWSYDYLRGIGHVRKALVITPLSTLERTWGDEIFNHFPHLTAAVLHGTPEKRLKLLATDADLYLINHDGVKVRGIVEALAKRPDIDLIIIDEVAQVGRTAGTARFIAINTLVNKQHPRLCWGLTGTPTPNNPTDAWAQCRLIAPARVPPYQTRFRDMVMRQVGPFRWIPRPTANDIVRDAMQPAVRHRRDECIDLPPCVYQTRQVEMTREQQKAYKDMVAKLVTEIDSGQVLAVNDGVKAMKLLQIAAGSAYGKDGETLQLDASPRLAEVREVVEAAATKTIVFVPFVASVHRVAAYLREQGFSVECIYGEVSKGERDRIFSTFTGQQDPQVLVAQPAAMSHGLTLTAANTIIWYAPVPSNEVFEQANARITRPGQQHSQFIVMLEGTDLERKYYQRLRDRQKVQGLLLDSIEALRHESKGGTAHIDAPITTP